MPVGSTKSRPRFPGGIPHGTRGLDRKFYTIADRYLDAMFAAYPSLATIVGYHRHDGLLEDYTAAGIAAKEDLARSYRAELGAIDSGALSTSARIDFELLINEIDGAIFNLTALRPHERDPQFYVDLLGNATLYLTIQEPDSPAWPDRLSALLSRMRRLPEFLAAARHNLKNPPLVNTDLAIQTNAGNIVFFESTAPALFSRAPAIREELRAASRRAAAELRTFQAWLENDLRPRSGGDWRLGRDLWSRKLAYTLQTTVDPAEIIRRAEERLRSERHRMLSVAEPLHTRMFPDHRHPESGEDRIQVVVPEVLEEVCRRHPTRETLFEQTRNSVVRAKRFIRESGLIGLPPDGDSFVVEPTPGFLDGVAVAFFSPPPILEPELKKAYWISSVPRGGSVERDREIEASFFREYNDYGLQSLTMHEAFPGHYVQYWHALRSPIATVYKKIFASGTFSEGWAVLAEKQMFDTGYAADEPENLLIHIKQNLRTPMNAILDARLHTTSMTDEEVDRWALDLMQRTCFQEEAEARGKLRRAKVTSTQLSTYFVGFMELLDILEESRRRAGDAWDLRAFNERLLSFGTIPPHHVRELLRVSEA